MSRKHSRFGNMIYKSLLNGKTFLKTSFNRRNKVQTSRCYEIINNGKAVHCKRSCLKSLDWWQIRYVDCKCSFQGCAFEASENKSEQAGQWGQVCRVCTEQNWVDESVEKVERSMQLSTVHPRHCCSPRAGSRPGARTQSGLESWTLAEGGGTEHTARANWWGLVGGK